MKAEKNHGTVYAAPFYPEELERMRRELRSVERDLDRRDRETVVPTNQLETAIQTNNHLPPLDKFRAQSAEQTDQLASRLAAHQQQAQDRKEAHVNTLIQLEAEIEATANLRRQQREARMTEFKRGRREILSPRAEGPALRTSDMASQAISPDMLGSDVTLDNSQPAGPQGRSSIKSRFFFWARR